MRHLFVLIAMLLANSPAYGDQSKRFSDFEVHYAAMATTDLLPEIALTYHIDRSPSRGMVTIAVLKKNSAGITVPVKATVKTNVVNLNSQLANVEIREITEQDAVYYIGQFPISVPDTLTFNVTVEPAGGKVKGQFAFQREFSK